MHWPPKSPTSRMHWMSCVQTNPITQLHRAQVTNFKHRPIANNKQTPHARHFCTGFHWFGKEGAHGQCKERMLITLGPMQWWVKPNNASSKNIHLSQHLTGMCSSLFIHLLSRLVMDCDIRNVPFLGHTSRKQEGVPSTLPRQTSNLHHWRWRSRLHTSIGLSEGFCPAWNSPLEVIHVIFDPAWTQLGAEHILRFVESHLASGPFCLSSSINSSKSLRPLWNQETSWLGMFLLHKQ